MPNFRLLGDPYDSGEQPRFVTWNDPRLFEIFLGRLRLDSILYDKIVLNDASIFEGIFFLMAARLGRLKDLPWERIEVRARAQDISTCITNWYTARTGQKLIPVYHASLTGTADVSALGSAIGQNKAADINSLRDYIELLKSLGVPSERAEEQLDAWNSLDAFFRSSKALDAWGHGFDIKPYLSRSRSYAENVIDTGPGKEVFKEVLDSNSRHRVYEILDVARVSATDQMLDDIGTIRTWYNIAYRSAQARANNCDNVEYFVSSNCRPYNDPELPLTKRLSALKSATEIEILPEFLYSLGHMPKEQFDLLVSNAISSGVAQWRAMVQTHHFSSRDQLKRTMETLAEATQNISAVHLKDDPLFDIPEVTSAASAAIAYDQVRKTTFELSKREFISWTAGAAGSVTVGPTVLKIAKSLSPSPESKIAEVIVRMQDYRL